MKGFNHKWALFKNMIKELRDLSSDLSNKYGIDIICEPKISFKVNKKFWVFQLNPYRCNLKADNYGIERELISGKWIKVPNLKTFNL